MRDLKKIAYVITDLSYGGAQTMLLQLVKNLDKSIFQAEIFIRESRLNTDIEKQFDEMKIKCHYLCLNDNNFKGSKIAHKVKAFFKMKKELDLFQPDIIHAHLENFYSAIYCVLRNKKYIFTVHSFPDRIIDRKFNVLLQLLRKKNKLVIVGCAKCVTKKTIELLGKAFDDLVVTIYNPIDYKKYDLKGRRLGKIFIHVGRLTPIKNQKLLIDSFKVFSVNNADSKLLIVGDGELKETLERYVKNENLQNRIDFLGNRADIANLLAFSDCFVLTSNSECCPMCILEAMASGLPIISTDVGGVSEIIEDSGILVKNSRNLIEAMNAMYQNSEYRLQLGEKAKKLALKYDAAKIVKKYMELYNKSA